MEEEKGIMSEFAIASLVMGIVSFIQIFGMEKAIVAVVFGLLALKRINRNAPLQGRKLAIAGIILGVISVILTIIFTIKFFPQLRQMQQMLQK
jgi:Na+/proline symporter